MIGAHPAQLLREWKQENENLSGRFGGHSPPYYWLVYLCGESIPIIDIIQNITSSFYPAQLEITYQMLSRKKQFKNFRLD